MTTGRGVRPCAAVRLTREEALALRVSKHHLDHRALAGRWLQVVSEIGGLQAQSMSAARMALWARVEDLVANSFDDALLQRRVVVKVYGMRGTVHVLTAKDWPLYFTALKRSRRGDTLHGRKLAPDVVDAAMREATRILSAGPVTMKELAERIPTKLRNVLTSSGPYPWHALVKDLMESVSVCFGPPRGQEVTYVTSDRWLTLKPRRIAIVKAEQELAERYLRAFAPATSSDFAYWSGLPRAVAHRAFDALGDLVEVSVGGQRSWIPRDDLQQLRRLLPRSSVRLLPNFDTYLLGHEDKTICLDAAHHEKVFPGAARVAQTVLANGRVIGTWAATRVGRALRVDVGSFEKLPMSVRDALEEEAARLAKFLGADHAEVKIPRSIARREGMGSAKTERGARKDRSTERPPSRRVGGGQRGG